MTTPELLVQTRLIPPRPRRQWLSRPRLTALLGRMGDVPLTLVIAGTGYGKSTTLAGFFAAQRWPLGWYSLGDEDRDPVRFLRHAIGALRLCVPGVGEQALNSLTTGWSPALGERAIDMLCNELLALLPTDTFLVLDDYQYVDAAAALCDALLEQRGSAAFLQRLHGEELFLLSIGAEHYRYHQLFQDFLQEQAQRQEVPLTERHRRVAEWYRQDGQDEEAIDMSEALDALGIRLP